MSGSLECLWGLELGADWARQGDTDSPRNSSSLWVTSLGISGGTVPLLQQRDVTEDTLKGFRPNQAFSWPGWLMAAVFQYLLL